MRSQVSKSTCIIPASRQNKAKSAMSFSTELAIWSLLKRLALGVGLIALLSAVLLVSDLGHRKMASASST